MHALRHRPDNITPLAMCRFVLCNSRLPRNTHTSQTKARVTLYEQKYDCGQKASLLSWTLSGSVTTPRGLLHGSARQRRLACGLAVLRPRGAVAHSSVPGESHHGVVVVGLGLGVGVLGCQGYGLAPVLGPPVITTIDVVKTETDDLFPRSKGSSVQPCKVSNWPGANPYYGTMTALTPCSMTSLTPGRPVGTGFISMSLPDGSLAR